MLYRDTRSENSARRGVVLLAVLVVVAVLALTAYRFNDVIMAEEVAADSYARSVQARSLAEAGVSYAAALLSNPDNLASINANPYDNPAAFRDVLVRQSENPRYQGRFSLIAPPDPDLGTQANLRYGVIDECSKLNINALVKLDSSGRIAHDVLMKLPNMTEEIANAIIDWIDEDEQPRTGGGENEYYPTLTPPYYCKNGPLDSLEELLFVRGVTPELLFGNDFNRNGLLDPEEEGVAGTLDRGWSTYLTVYSRELNVDSTGVPRIYINDSDLAGLYEKLATAIGEEMATFVILYRQYGGTSTQSSSGDASSDSQSGGSQSGGSPSGGSSGGASPSSGAALSPDVLGELQTSARRTRRVSSLYTLVDCQVSVPGPDSRSAPTVYVSPLLDPGILADTFPLMLDKLTTSQEPEIPARVNINTAPGAVLAALPNMTEADVQAIIGARPLPSSDAVDPLYQSCAWVMSDAGLPPRTLQSLERYVTGRSQVYRVQVLGHFDGGGPSARLEAVIDTNAGRPRVVFWRDLTELGKGYNLTPAP